MEDTPTAPQTESSTAEAAIGDQVKDETQQLDSASGVKESTVASCHSRSISPVFFIGPLANTASVDVGHGAKDIPDPLAVHGSCGLSNLGNTCFMNAGIQALASCTPLLKFFFEEFQFRENLRGTLTGAFYILLCKIWSGRFSVIHPRPFKELLGLYHPQFLDYRQHDCQEFLALLLDTFHEQLNELPSICVTGAASDKCSSSDIQTSDHLNNQDQAVDCAGSPEKVAVPGPTDDLGGGLSVKEGYYCSASPESVLSVEAGSRAGSSTPEVILSRNLKRTSSSPADAMVAALISEDSNHSSVSVQSTDSEQTSAFKKLKIDAENAARKNSPAPDFETEVTLTMPHLVTVSSGVSELSDSHDAGLVAETAGEPMEVSRDFEGCAASIPEGSVLGGMRTLSGSRLKQAAKEHSSSKKEHIHSSSVSKEHPVPENEAAYVLHQLGGSPSRVFNKTDNRPDLSSAHHSFTLSSAPSFAESCSSHDLPSSSSQEQSQPLPCLDDYYCKETKTLNTNVLVSCYNHGDVIAVDSEKFAKIDNRSQVPVAKEVNLLQEALQDSDKVDKALIGKTLGSKSSNVHSGPSADKTAGTSSNLRVVKTHNSTTLRKPSFDSNLLNNSYEFDEDVLGYDGLVSATLTVDDGAVLGVECSKTEEEVGGVAAKMMDIPEELKPLEVEKNVQMQALSKFKTAMAKSNIREDISDKASTSESTETEDADMEAESSEDEEEEEEETPSRDIVGEDNLGLLNPARCYTSADVAAANASWESYKARNNSVVVNTFQGQFKSTVVCSECDHVSVTYEPFMYLSLPIPHAMERQICVVLIRPQDPAMRYMVTVHKNDKVQRLRQELQALTGTGTCDVILAEVLDRHVSRLLDDNIMLRYVNDTSRTICAFEMLPPPEVAKDCPSPGESSAPTQHHTFSTTAQQHIPSRRPAETCTSQTQDQGDVGRPLKTSGDLSRPLKIDTTGMGSEDAFGGKENGRHLKIDTAGAGSGDTFGGKERNAHFDSPLLSEKELNNMLRASATVGFSGSSASLVTPSALSPQGMDPPSSRADPFLAGTGLLEWSEEREFSSSSSLVPEVSPPPCSPLSEPTNSPSSFCADFITDAHCRGDGLLRSPAASTGMEHLPSGSAQMWEGVIGEGTGDAGANSSPRGSGLMDQWQICAICLEEMVDSELLTHLSCTGVFCHTCLEMSAKHSGDLAHCCPICLSPVDVTQDFVPLAGTCTVKCKVRILAVPITFRCEHQAFMEGDGGCGLELICGPRLVYVASQQDASTLYSLIDRVCPFQAVYSLHFTDGQGLRCSRCEYGAHCLGCEIPHEGEVTLQPGDNLSVQFAHLLPGDEIEKSNQMSEDKSLKHLRSRDPISIFDCFDAFTQSEVLDEHNPWYCPCCCRNQCAKKTMTVWRYPDSLIIHLKRFVYEDLASTKIDNRVVFPHTDLDVTRFLAGPPMSFNVYDLHSIVCHYGGANSGHYTSFTCHPLTQQWYNYNDETVTQQKPGDSEFDSGYVLFYRRQGTQVEFSLVKDLPYTEEESALASITSTTSTTLYHQPPPTSLSPSPSTAAVSATITLDMDSLPLGESGVGSGASKTAEAVRCDTSNSYDFYH